MKTTALAVLAVAGCAGVANAQAFYDVQVTDFFSGTPVSEIDVRSTDFVQVSVYLDRNGSTAGFFNSFTAWSQFAGQMATSTGSWFVDESQAVFGQAQTSTNDLWLGRRPTAETFYPSGAAGGFRYNSETYSLSNGGTVLGGSSNGNFEGITAASALNGFLHDTSERLEVFRAILDFSSIPLHEGPNGGLIGTDSILVDIDYLAAATQIFIDPEFNISRFVTAEMDGGSAQLTLVPTPASVALLGLGGLAAGRRRR